MNLDIYIISILIIMTAFIKVLPLDKKKNKIYINISFIILFIILILREPYSDMIRYIQVFKQTNLQTFSSILELRWEVLYLVLNLIVKLFTESERIFIIVLAVLTLVGPYTFIKKYSDNYFFSLIFFIILGIYNYNFYIIRQAIAISILLMSIKHIEQKSLIKFLLYIIVAAGFHTSSIIFIIAYPLCNIKINIKGIIIYFFSSILVFLSSKKIVSLIYSISSYSTYSERQSVSDGKGRLILLILIFIAVLILNYKNGKIDLNSKKIFDKREKGDKNTIFFNMLMIGIIFQVLAIRQSVIVRLANIFITGAIILIPNAIYETKDKNYKYAICTAILICAILYAIYIPTIKNYMIYL